MNQMVEALDHEVGKLMIETGLATRATDGNLEFHPETTNTMVIIIGDNGSFAPTVKAPFNFDGLTSDPDLSIISENFGSNCLN